MKKSRPPIASAATPSDFVHAVHGLDSVPHIWRPELQAVLINEAQLKRRVRTLARQIERDFVGRELTVVALLTGTVLFLADLIRHLNLPLRLDFIAISSYGAGLRPGQLVVTKELRLEVRGRDVLVVDDILDTGNTLHYIQSKLRRLHPRRMKTCVLLDKPARRQKTVQADYVGFTIPDVFVVGYGLDYAERYRNLPFVAVLRSHRCRNSSGRARPSPARLTPLPKRSATLPPPKSPRLPELRADPPSSNSATLSEVDRRPLRAARRHSE